MSRESFSEPYPRKNRPTFPISSSKPPLLQPARKRRRTKHKFEVEVPEATITASSPAASTLLRAHHRHVLRMGKARQGLPDTCCNGCCIARTIAVAAKHAFAVVLCFLSGAVLSSSTAVADTSVGNPSTAEDAGSQTSLWELISGHANYTKLAACLQAADPSLVAALRDSRQHPLTLFAPDNAAFEQPDWQNPGSENDTIFSCK